MSKLFGIGASFQNGIQVWGHLTLLTKMFDYLVIFLPCFPLLHILNRDHEVTSCWPCWNVSKITHSLLHFNLCHNWERFFCRKYDHSDTRTQQYNVIKTAKKLSLWELQSKCCWSWHLSSMMAVVNTWVFICVVLILGSNNNCMRKKRVWGMVHLKGCSDHTSW